MQPYQPTGYAGCDAYTGRDGVWKYSWFNVDEFATIKTHRLWELNREFNNQKLFKDQIERIKKGKEGGDIIHRVIHNAQICGSILLESKNTTRFMSTYISKLRNDQTRENADHAVLVTSAFPATVAGRHLLLRDGVLIVSPRLVIPVEHLLRKQILNAHGLRLRKEGRREQRDALYEFVVSDAAAELWGQFATLTAGLRELDQAEMERHRRVWTMRAGLIDSLVGLRDRVSEKVQDIISLDRSTASE